MTECDHCGGIVGQTCSCGKFIEITQKHSMTTISQAARDAATAEIHEKILFRGHHTQQAIDSETASLRQQLEEAKARDLESDSTIGSCNCLTKTPEVHFHKPGCKYRIISERDTAVARVTELEAQCAAQRNALSELFAMVRGECPSLLDEDSGGNARLSLEIDTALSSTAGASTLARVKELEKDKARLDWLVFCEGAKKLHARLQQQSNGAWCVFDCSKGLTFASRDEPTWQSAIDAAMAKDQEQDAGGER